MCVFVWVCWCGGKQWQPLLQSHSYLELIWHCSCVLFRIIISQRSDTYLQPHSGASQSTKDQIFDGYFSNSFLVLHGNKGQSLNWVCKRAAMCQRLTLNFTVNCWSSHSYLFVISFCLLVCGDFIGTGVLMWWRAPWAVWWRMGWRRTSNQTINAVPGANVRELREYLLLSSSVLHISSDSSSLLLESVFSLAPPVSCPQFHRSLNHLFVHIFQMFPVCGYWFHSALFIFSLESLVWKVSGCVLTCM